MRRILAMVLLLAGVGAFALVSAGASDGEDKQGNPTYFVELSDAFGLIEGADLKVAGTRAGKIASMKIDRETNNALIGVELTEKGFSPLRKDVFCESRPQSLIGEYFIDCQPGTDPEKLPDGARIPIRQTASTIGADLVNNVLRLPQRERLRLILNELGTGLAARGEDLNAAIRRGVPALRETDKLLALLADQGQVIADLNRDADTVVTALAGNRTDVGRFVVEARDTAVASAERRVELAQTFARLPGFLRELRPTMFELGRVADAQTPALRDLGATSVQLTRFLDNLGPFSDASRPAITSLGETSAVGRDAIPALRPTVQQLGRFTANAPELGKNLAIVLEDLYDRDRAVEPDPRSPGGRGFNGFEAILNYTFWQSQAINIFDENGYILKVSVRENECAAYADARRVKSDPEYAKHCSSGLGPNQPGINRPDPSTSYPVTGGPIAPVSQQQQAAAAQRAQQDAAIVGAGQAAAGGAPAPAAGGAGSGATRAQGPPISLEQTIGSLLGGGAPKTPDLGPAVNGLGNGAADSQATGDLLDYLLAP